MFKSSEIGKVAENILLTWIDVGPVFKDAYASAVGQIHDEKKFSVL